MPRFFVEQINGDTCIITGGDAWHIGRSLRMKIGDELILCSDAVDYTAKILTISDERVACSILSSEISKAEPKLKITLFQAMPKGDKLEEIIQKCVEVGVCEIVPVLTSRCVSRPDRKSFEKKLTRYEKISLEASKQSGRGIIPRISQIISFEECLSTMKSLDKALVCYEKGGIRIDKGIVEDITNIGVLIGSEGGFEETEIEKCKSSDVIPVWLGERILRCETAPTVAASLLLHENGDL